MLGEAMVPDVRFKLGKIGLKRANLVPDVWGGNGA